MISQDEADAEIRKLSANSFIKESLGNFYRTGVEQTLDISLTGGGNRVNYLLNAAYNGDVSNIKGNSDNRYSFNNLVTIKPAENLTLGFGVNYAIQDNFLNGINWIENVNTSIGLVPAYTRLMGENSEHLSLSRTYREIFTDTAGGGQLLDWKYKPLDELSMANNQFSSHDILARFNINYKINNELSFLIYSQVQRLSNSRKNNYDIDSYYARNLINRYTQLKNETIYGIPLGGILDTYYRQLNSWSTRGQMNFNRVFGKIHDINVIAGGEIRELEDKTESNRIYGYNNENLNFHLVDFVNLYPIYANLSSPQKIPSRNNLTEKANRFVSFYSNMGYALHDRYFINASLRKDASNLFGLTTNNKWNPFWSSGIGWEVSKEPFYRSKLVSYLKLRLTYGYNGNINNRVAAVPTIEHRGIHFLTDLPYAEVRNLKNQNLRWENSAITNLAIDIRALNNRLNGSIEYYKKRSTDLISPTSVDPTSGISLMQLNVASLKSSGLDIKLNALVSERKVKWDINLIASYSKSIVSKYFNESANKSSYINNGQIITPRLESEPYSIVSYRFAGLNNEGNPVGYFEGKESTNYLSIVYSPTWDDIVISGSARPRWYGNIINSIRWKNITFSANISLKADYYFRRFTIDYSQLFNSGVGHEDFYKRWQSLGDERYTSIPAMIYPVNSARENFYGNSEATVSKGDHVRLQDISIHYEPGKAESKMFKDLKVYFYATNLAIIWKANKYNLDPDYPAGIKPPFTIAFGVTKKF